MEEVLAVVKTTGEYSRIGMSTEIDPAAATLAPLYKSSMCDEYDAKISVTLPMFRLFSQEAQAGIIAHEFAHAVDASKLGKGWHEKMQARYAAGERE